MLPLMRESLSKKDYKLQHVIESAVHSGLAITHAQVARTTAAIAQVAPLRARTHAAYKGGRSY